jgi:hypothetical protein
LLSGLLSSAFVGPYYQDIRYIVRGCVIRCVEKEY